MHLYIYIYISLSRFFFLKKNVKYSYFLLIKLIEHDTYYIIFHRMRFDERTETYRRWCRDSS